jgi:hypothetical protein
LSRKEGANSQNRGEFGNQDTGSTAGIFHRTFGFNSLMMASFELSTSNALLPAVNIGGKELQRIVAF